MKRSDTPVRSESAIRPLLRAFLRRSIPDIRQLIDEFWVPRTNERADVAVICPDFIHGIEIKTARDTLKRLPRQAQAYARVFDWCTAAVAPQHRAAAVELLPSWWGVVEIESAAGDVRFDILRAPTLNTGIDPEIIVRLLWRDEAFAALRAIDVDASERASRSLLWTELLERVDPNQIRSLVRMALVNRDPSRARVQTRRFTQLADAVAP
ncbi:MAG: sce7726 family protein [Acidimicrobiia bacterium]